MCSHTLHVYVYFLTILCVSTWMVGRSLYFVMVIESSRDLWKRDLGSTGDRTYNTTINRRNEVSNQKKKKFSVHLHRDS